MNKEQQQVQEGQYSFPYHYLVRWEQNTFRQYRSYAWGYRYLAYILFIAEQLKTISFDTLADVGCGDGRFLLELSRCFPDKKLTGIDYSEQAVRFAGSFVPNIPVHRLDITRDAPVPARFDVITLIETLEHIPPDSVEEFVAALRAMLNPGGTLLLTVPSTNTPVHRKHFQHFNADTIAQALSPHFEIQECHFVNRQCWQDKLLARLLQNRFFILNEPRILNRLFKWYRKRHFHCGPDNCFRIAVRAVPVAQPAGHSESGMVSSGN